MLVPLEQGQSLYIQIYNFVRSSVLSGRLKSGTRLPSTRAWAKELNVSRTSVLLALDQLSAEGYVKSIKGSGTYVSDGMPDTFPQPGPQTNREEDTEDPVALSEFGKRVLAGQASQPPGPILEHSTRLYDFHYGNREALDFPHKLWQRLSSRHTAHAVPTRSPVAGYPPLREAIAQYLRDTRAVRCRPDQIVIVNGSQQALDLLARILVDPGDPVILEEPHYHGARQVFRSVGARLIPCPVDEEGLRVGDLPEGSVHPRLVYVTPSHQFPTGAVLPISRRLALIAWAQRHQAFIIEDDYDGELRYDCRPVEAVQSHDHHGRVIYVGTFSKALTPELRVGYVVVPKNLLRPFLAAKWVNDLFAPTLTQKVLADFLREGHYERHLRRLRERHAGRRRALLEALQTHLGDRAIASGVKAGMHIMVWLPTVPVPELLQLIEQAKQLGVVLYPVTDYYLGTPPRSGVVLSFSSLTEHEIQRGIRQFAKTVRSCW